MWKVVDQHRVICKVLPFVCDHISWAKSTRNTWAKCHMKLSPHTCTHSNCSTHWQSPTEWTLLPTCPCGIKKVAGQPCSYWWLHLRGLHIFARLASQSSMAQLAIKKEKKKKTILLLSGSRKGFREEQVRCACRAVPLSAPSPALRDDDAVPGQRRVPFAYCKVLQLTIKVESWTSWLLTKECIVLANITQEWKDETHAITSTLFN